MGCGASTTAADPFDTQGSSGEGISNVLLLPPAEWLAGLRLLPGARDAVIEWCDEQGVGEMGDLVHMDKVAVLSTLPRVQQAKLKEALSSLAAVIHADRGTWPAWEDGHVDIGTPVSAISNATPEELRSTEPAAPPAAAVAATATVSDSTTVSGSTEGQGPAAIAAELLQSSAEERLAKKHVMLSYQWDHQTQAKRAYELLTKLGLNIWMDITGGMETDIYDSMAAGVSNAVVVVCFMSQKYEDSPNCKLELKFAQQSGVDIVPVMMEGGGWKASGWLGLVTAGALWTPLHEAANFEENVRQLHGQVLKSIGGNDGSLANDGDVSADIGSSSQEAKEELERLRESQEAAQSSVAMVLADPAQPATIPAGVPKLPPCFHATSEIQTLTRLVLSISGSDKPRVGFSGMGGIGKTVMGAAIVRNDDVRLRFDVVVWLPIGQTPIIAKLQNLCHMQCTGKELSPEFSSEEKKQALQQAMAGKCILLCLDDLWEEQHETELNFADVGAGSKVLISTRMKGLLTGAHQLEVGLPLALDAARMLLSVAGVNDVSSSSSTSNMPTGVPEVVDLCGRLPLALGIAGRLAANLGLVGAQDWSDMIGVLKEELRESHSGGTEEGMIRASLRGLKGSAQEQANVRDLLKLFAVVPEDTHCPLEVLLLMFKAVHESSLATIMHIRKWLWILIDRSLVLGTVDRPSLHDLVLDFAVAQHTKEELRSMHRAVVEAFRVARPADFHGRRYFDATQVDSAISLYVLNEVAGHVTNAYGGDEILCKWVTDVPQDAIVMSAGQEMGSEALVSAATAAEASGDMWLAARYWTVARTAIYEIEGTAGTLETTCKSFDAMTQVKRSDDLQMNADCDDLQLLAVLNLLVQDHKDALNEPRSETALRVLSSSGGDREPALAAAIRWFFAIYMVQMNMVDAGAEMLAEIVLALAQSARNDPDPSMRYKCSMMQYNLVLCYFDLLLLTPNYKWDSVFGRDGLVMLEAARSFDYDKIHEFLVKSTDGDWCHTPMAAAGLAVHYGNMGGYAEVVDCTLTNLRRMIEEPDQTVEVAAVAFTLPSWCSAVHFFEMSLNTRDTVTNMMVDYGFTFSKAREVISTITVTWYRRVGDTTQNKYYVSCETCLWLAQYGYLLVSSNPGMTSDEVIQSLPSLETVINQATTTDGISPMTSMFGCFSNPLITLGAVCEKFGRPDIALQFASAALGPEASAGTRLPSTRTLAMMMQGRSYAALGRLVDASAAFEAAVSEACCYELWLFEAFALRDLKLHVLDQMGHSVHGSRRLGASLRKLMGPADLLTPMMKGMDADELIAMDGPEAAYQVEFTSPESEATPVVM